MLLRALAERILQLTCDRLPPDAVAMAKQGILDTTGVTSADVDDETTATVARALRKSAAPGDRGRHEGAGNRDAQPRLCLT